MNLRIASSILTGFSSKTKALPLKQRISIPTLKPLQSDVLSFKGGGPDRPGTQPVGTPLRTGEDAEAGKIRLEKERQKRERLEKEQAEYGDKGVYNELDPRSVGEIIDDIPLNSDDPALKAIIETFQNAKAAKNT